MEDKEIIQMYLDRDERAITETSEKYGSLCYNIAYNILFSKEDSEECVNDAFLGAWNSIPPNIPRFLAVYLAKITRNLSIGKLRATTAKKRNKAQETALEELDSYLCSKESVFENIEAKELKKAIQKFLRKQPPVNRNVFICRYFYCDTIEDISKNFRFSQSKVKTTLFRLRKKLKEHLIKEGLLDE